MANLSVYDVDWSDDEGINLETHRDYLQKFCEDFKLKMIERIDAAMEEKDKTVQVLLAVLVETRAHVPDGSKQ